MPDELDDLSLETLEAIKAARNNARVVAEAQRAFPSEGQYGAAGRPPSNVIQTLPGSTDIPQKGSLQQLFSLITKNMPSPPTTTFTGSPTQDLTLQGPSEDLGQRMVSALGMGVAGRSPLAAGIGAVMPARNSAQLIEDMAGASYGGGLGKVTQGVQGLVKKPVMQGLAGLLTSMGAGATRQAANMTGATGEEVNTSPDAGKLLMSLLFPMLISGGFDQPGATSKMARGLEVARDISGEDLEKLRDVRSLQTAKFGETVKTELEQKALGEKFKEQAAKEPYYKQIQTLLEEKFGLGKRKATLRGTLESRQAEKARQLGSVETDLSDAKINLDFWKDKFKQYAQDEPRRAQQDDYMTKFVNPWKERVAELERQKTALSSGQFSESINRSIAATRQNLTAVNKAVQEKQKVLTTVDNELDALNRNYISATAMTPGLKETLAKGKTAETLFGFLFQPHSVKDTTGHIRELMGASSPAARNAIQKGTRYSFLQSLFPEGGIATPESLKATQDRFKYNKLYEAFGGAKNDVEARRLATTMSDVAEDYTLATRSELLSFMEKRAPMAIASAALTSAGLFPLYPHYSAAAATVGGGVLFVVGWDKMIRSFSENPVLGRQFHQWATKGGLSEQALKYFPALYGWINENKVEVSPEQMNQRGLGSARIAPDINAEQ